MTNLCSTCQYEGSCFLSSEDTQTCVSYVKGSSLSKKEEFNPIQKFVLLCKALEKGYEFEMSTGHILILSQDFVPVVKLTSSSGEEFGGMVSWDVVFSEARKLNPKQLNKLAIFLMLNSLVDKEEELL